VTGLSRGRRRGLAGRMAEVVAREFEMEVTELAPERSDRTSDALSDAIPVARVAANSLRAIMSLDRRGKRLCEKRTITDRIRHRGFRRLH
jgi:predicted nucleic acid-binding protein